MTMKRIILPVTLMLIGIATSSSSAKAFNGNLDLTASFSLKAYQSSILPASTEAEGESAKATIDQMGQKAISFLTNESFTQSDKEREFRKLLKSNFDMSTIGRFALGNNWKQATDAQKNEYQKLFENLIVKVYSARFNDYNGQKFDVTSYQETGNNDINVTSYIVPDSGSKVKVDWRMRNKGGQYKIVDVIIEGVSMSMTQRSDFASVIQRGGGNVDVLLAHLRE